MARSVWKGPFVDACLLTKAKKMKDANKFEPIKTWSRRSVIVPFFVGLTFEVHNGKKMIPVFIDEDKVGRKLGEFAPTRTFHGHASDKKVKRQ